LSNGGIPASLNLGKRLTIFIHMRLMDPLTISHFPLNPST